MTSMRCARRRLNDSSIWRMPASRPVVQTLVARNSRLCTPNSAARSPTTLSDLPYIGDESTTLPPKRTNSRKTSLSGSREDFPEPTSKVCQVPRPMADNDSSVFGIGLRRIESAIAISPASAKVPAPSAILTNSRRDMQLEGEKFNCTRTLKPVDLTLNARSALLTQHCHMPILSLGFRLRSLTRGMPLQSPAIQNSVKLPNTPRGIASAMIKYHKLSA